MLVVKGNRSYNYIITGSNVIRDLKQHTDIYQICHIRFVAKLTDDRIEFWNCPVRQAGEQFYAGDICCNGYGAYLETAQRLIINIM